MPTLPKVAAAFIAKPPARVRWGRAATPFGPVLFGMTEDGTICRISFAPRQGAAHILKTWKKKWQQTEFVKDGGAAAKTAQRIFSGKKSSGAKSVIVCLAGTPFQCRVWKALMDLKPGQVASYGELARRIKKPGAARAVGNALGANPVPILVPCHRVIASNGRIGGYTGGIAIKKRLLRAENVRLSAS
jgi:AraC family transcriptional regulator, regulatory protein of adaptative response / methylated-DNA-[protein]-cysteine methyltransferase